MRQTAFVAAVVLAVGTGWLGVNLGLGEEPQAPPVSARPPAGAPPAAAPAPREPAQAPPAPVAKAAKGEAARPESPGMVTPPAPLPDVEIPPIPEVGQDPFKPGPPPVRPRKPDVIEEGKRLFEREGRLEVDPLGRPFFVFDGGEKPMPILENTVREMLESATDRGKRRARWRISGTVTVYEGKNFILVTRATRILPEEETF